MAMQVRATQASMDASWGLFQRMFPGNERDVPNLIFGTSQPPLPIAFNDPEHQLTKDLEAILMRTITSFITQVTVSEIGLDVRQVEQLDVQDLRIVTLKQRVLDEIARTPIVQQLRVERMRLLTRFNNKMLLN